MIKIKGLSANQLKIIAAVSMTIDHIGSQLFPDYILLRIVGRIAFPIFAYLFAEGWRYTHNRKKHFITIAVLAAACQLVYFLVTKSLYHGVLVTFTLSAVLISAADNIVKKDTAQNRFILLFSFAITFAITELLPRLFSGSGFYVDYGLCGVLFPLLIYIAETKEHKLVFTALALTLLSSAIGGIQWYSFAAFPLLTLYNGEKGRINMKNFFYVYYPFHLSVIYIIKCLASR